MPFNDILARFLAGAIWLLLITTVVREIRARRAKHVPAPFSVADCYCPDLCDDGEEFIEGERRTA